MHKRLLHALLVGASLLAASATALANDGRHDDDRHTLSIAVYGDAPYGTSNSDQAQFNATPAFIETINHDPDVSLVLHAGDIHSGKQTCSFAYDQSIYQLWQAFKRPLIYTPGDNEWTDCHKTKEGSQDPIANLAYVRQIFFANPGHALAVDKALISQATAYNPAYPSDAEYVENVMWVQGGVVFVTVNIPGGSNNDEDNWYGAARTDAQTAEILKRTGAALRWLDQGFDYARRQHARAVILLVQADMWDLDGTAQGDMHIGNYRPYIDNIVLHTAQFGRPVLLINGDSHGYRSDNPLRKGAPCVTESGTSEIACTDDAYATQPFGYDLRNFHRIVVHGSAAPMEWVKLQVHQEEGEAQRDNRSGPDAFGPFSWQRKVQTLP